ncbi:MAG: fibronectin type III domain-containing protein, partial [Oscillospiraceae bacterium]|nr:fibronectin type III domain-containing protein [Oscillospiraceae bacterium]
MKFRKSIIGAILAAVISVTAIAPCNVVYADTSKTVSDENDTPTNFKSSKTATAITLSWDEVDGADAYRVYMYNSASGKYEKYKNVKKNSCKITGLSKGTKYY